MRMTRSPARSFTFEVKRANRRVPEVVTLSKAPVSESASLADQVFGKLSARPRARQADKIEVPAPVGSTASAPQPPEVFGTTESAEKSARRVLPDLLSVPVSPVEERVQREAEERAVRRRAARASRATKEAKRPSVATTRENTTPAVSTATRSVVIEAMIGADQPLEAITTSPQPVKLVPTSRRRKRNALLTAFRRAGRNGRAVPRLPAGQRWKRRLPQVCW